MGYHFDINDILDRADVLSTQYGSLNDAQLTRLLNSSNKFVDVGVTDSWYYELVMTSPRQGMYSSQFEKLIRLAMNDYQQEHFPEGAH